MYNSAKKTLKLTHGQLQSRNFFRGSWWNLYT